MKFDPSIALEFYTTTQFLPLLLLHIEIHILMPLRKDLTQHWLIGRHRKKYIRIGHNIAMV